VLRLNGLAWFGVATAATLATAVLAPAAAVAASDEAKDSETEVAEAYVAVELRGPGAARPMTIVLRRGTTGFYRDANEGFAVAVVATQVDLSANEAEFVVFDATLDQSAGRLQIEGERGSVYADLGQEMFVALPGGVLEVRPTRFGTTFEAVGVNRSNCLPWPPGNLLERCCIGCGSTMGCGCTVEAPCGSCTGNCFAGP
jgi:hypothetical protein